MEKSQSLNRATQFLKVAYDGECSPNFFFRNGLNFLRRLALRGKNLMTARVSMLLKSRASPDMFPFSLCNKKSLAIRQMN